MRNLPFDCTVGVLAALVTIHDQGLGCAPFDSVTLNGAAGPIYDATHLYTGQTKAIEIVGNATNSCYVEYTTSIGSQPSLFARYYVYFAANPSQTVEVGKMVAPSPGGSACALDITATGKVRLLNAGGGTIATSTASIALNQWVRLELDAVAGATATQTARLYNSADAAEGSPTETISGANVAGPNALGRHRIGMVSAGGAGNNYWITNLDTNNTGQLGPYVVPTGGHTWYVSKNGDNSTGDSWAHAWNEMDQFDWAAIAPGDTINLDGGPTKCGSVIALNPATWAATQPTQVGGMTYTKLLQFKTSGTALAPIVLKKSAEAGHNGTVIMFGGRPALLPEANAASYAPGVDETTILPWGLDLRGTTYITIDGTTRSGILAYGFGRNVSFADGHGCWCRLATTSNTIVLRNVESFDCGTYGFGTLNASPTGWAFAGWWTDKSSLEFEGSTITLSRCLFHDNGQDAIDIDALVDHFTLQDTWFYFSRLHSTFLGYGFNAGCQAIPLQDTTHVDGVQGYNGGQGEGPATVDHCIFGPFVNQGLYLGNQGDTTFDNIVVTNSLFLVAFSHGLQADAIGALTPTGWTIDHCTFHNATVAWGGYTNGWFGIEFNNGTANTLTNCLHKGSFFSASAFGTASGNYYQGDALPGGTARDPLFRNPLAATNNTPTFAQILALDLTPTDATVLASGAGSPLHTIQDLLNRIDRLNGVILPAGSLGLLGVGK